MSVSTDLTSLTSQNVVLNGQSNYQKWAWSIGGTARLGGFWPIFDGTNDPTDTSAAQHEMKALGLIMKTVDSVIALEIQSMPSITTTTTSRFPNTKEVWDFLKTKWRLLNLKWITGRPPS